MSREILRLLVENLDEIVFFRDEDRILYVNPAYERIWGMRREALYEDREAFFRPIHPADKQRIQAAVERQNDGASFEGEYRIVRPDGSVRWIRSRTFTLLKGDFDGVRVGGIVEDITDRKEAEAQRLERERRLRETLVREVHHRIKNNLQGVIGLLRRQIDTKPGVAADLMDAIAQIQSIAVVHGLQGIGRGEVRLCELTDAICRTVSGLAGIQIEPCHTVDIVTPVRITESEAVPVALILNELIMNAVKHTESSAGSQVSVRLVFDGDVARLEVLNRPAALRGDIDFASGSGLGTGLQLIRSLIPSAGATVQVRPFKNGVLALLELRSPTIEPSDDPLSDV